MITWTRRISAPASARAIVMAWPMPLVPPVTKAVCPSRENSCSTEVMIAVVVSSAAYENQQYSSTAADDTLHIYGGRLDPWFTHWFICGINQPSFSVLTSQHRNMDELCEDRKTRRHFPLSARFATSRASTSHIATSGPTNHHDNQDPCKSAKKCFV